MTQSGFGQQADVERWDPHENGGLGQFLENQFGVKTRQPNHFAAVDQRAMQSHEKTVHMKNRQRMDQHVTRLPAPVVLEHQRVAQQVVVREHGTLAATGGATGVENGRQVVGLHHGRHMPVTAMGGAL